MSLDEEIGGPDTKLSNLGLLTSAEVVLRTSDSRTLKVDWFLWRHTSRDVVIANIIRNKHLLFGFLPENFRRLVAKHRLNSSLPFWLGGPRMHNAPSHGVLLEPMLSCFSHGALLRIAKLVEALVEAESRSGLNVLHQPPLVMFEVSVAESDESGPQ